ncbi:MAG: hypothetical protein LC808_05050 [Actinobacteria bacterium]|nr:hypothetical protein [Actinomycetota bacterium]
MPEIAKSLAGDSATAAVRWPKNAIDPDGKDLVEPVASLLRQLALLESKADVEAGVRPVGGTPYSLQVITAGATSGAKIAGVAASSSSFIGALGSAYAAYNAGELPLKIALVSAVALILAAGVISVALIVRGDVSARAAGNCGGIRGASFGRGTVPSTGRF